MKLTHPTIHSISIDGNEYRAADGVFDLPDSAVEIAMTWFGFTEAKRGRVKRAKADGPPSAKAKPRSRKPKPKPQGGEMNGGMNLAVSSSYSLTPTFSFSGPGFGGLARPLPGHDTVYRLQGPSYKLETVAASDFASDIHRNDDRIGHETFTDARPCALRARRARWVRGGVIRPAPSTAPSNPVARYGYPTGPSPGACLR